MEKAVPNHESSPQFLSGLLPGGWYKALYLLSPFSGSSFLLLHGQMILRNSQNLPLSYSGYFHSSFHRNRHVNVDKEERKIL